MKKRLIGLAIVLAAMWISAWTADILAQAPDLAQPGQPAQPAAAPAPDAKVAAQPADASAPTATAQSVPPTVSLDKNKLDNGGQLSITGKAEPGQPVYLEVASADKVRASFFDSNFDKDQGKIPYVLYMTGEMPAFYRILVPVGQKDKLAEVKKEGGKWSYAKAVKDLGADAAYAVPAKAAIERYQATLLGSVIGSRGDKLDKPDDKETRRRSFQLAKARFRSVDKLFAAKVETSPDGTYKAVLDLPHGVAPGDYQVVAVAGQVRSAPAVFVNDIAFPLIYLSNAGTSLNLFYPFLLTLGIAIFGVLMGAGGGFLLNPILLSLWPLPHTVVAGTVMPTVLFSQLSGVYNYSKIKFISWKLGLALGASTVLGGFIGPKLTELITLDQYKFVFGWILVVLALLMFWQTLPAYLAKNKKEQAILKECRLRAEAAAKARQKPDPGCDESAKE